MHTIETLALDATMIATIGTIAAMFPTARYAAAGIVGTVAAVSIAGSAIGLAAVVVALGAVIALSDSGTVDTGYLERAPAVAKPAAAMQVRFLSPVWDCVDTESTGDDEADRLLACYSRAIASRHKARAAGYKARWIAHVRSGLAASSQA